MSTTSSISSGAQLLANDGLLPSNVTAQQLKTATPGQLLDLEIDKVESNTMSALFSEGASASDSASLSGSSADGSSSTAAESLVQALDAPVASASGSNTGGTAASSSANGSNEKVGTLFSYLG